MAITPQTAMPQRLPTTRPEGYARVAATGRHCMLSPVPDVRVGSAAAKIAALMLTTAFAVGTAVAIALVILTGTLTQLGR
jgi:hypothetical protein